MQAVWFLVVVKAVLAANNHKCHNEPLPCIELAIHSVDEGLCRELATAVDCTHIHGHSSDNTQPLCGTDGVSYPHHCDFAKERCKVILQINNNLNGQQVYQLDIAHDGNCIKGTVAPIPNCANNSCLDPTLSGQAVQQCLQILSLPCMTGVEVCGTDGKTYAHYCDLAKAHCKNANITKAHDTPCRVSTQQTTQTTHASTNAASTNAAASASTAPQSATSTLPPTTTDPPTTTSTLPTTTTQSATDILVHVFCLNAASITCNTGFNVICGSDGNFYPNDCEFSKVSCTKPGLRIMPDTSTCHVR